jgi:hypothetical protein
LLSLFVEQRWFFFNIRGMIEKHAFKMGDLDGRLTLSSPGTGKQLACCFLETVFCFKLTTFWLWFSCPFVYLT